MSPGTEEFVGSSNAHVQEVVKAAEEDLRQLIRRRDDIVKRIGAIRRTIVGLANALIPNKLVSNRRRRRLRRNQAIQAAKLLNLNGGQGRS